MVWIKGKNLDFNITCSAVVGEVIGSFLCRLKRVIAKDAKSYTCCCYVRCIIGMEWECLGKKQWFAKNQSGLALGCYQPSSEAWLEVRTKKLNAKNRQLSIFRVQLSRVAAGKKILHVFYGLNVIMKGVNNSLPPYSINPHFNSGLLLYLHAFFPSKIYY